MTDLDKLACQQLVRTAWKDVTQYEARQRSLQAAAAEASAPAWPAEPMPATNVTQGPQPPPGISPGPTTEGG